MTTTVIVTVTVDTPFEEDQALSEFEASAPRYRGMPGLARKYYILSEDRRTVGGIYVFRSRAAADALYTESWRASVRQRYGAEPDFAWYDTPVIVDNAAAGASSAA